MEIHNSFQTSVKKALDEIDIDWPKYRGLIICGTHSPENVEFLLDKITLARAKGLPFYGECFGHQLACIEWARNMMGISKATSQEFGLEGVFVVKKLPQLNVGLKDGESYWNNYAVKEDVEKDYFKNRPPNMFSSQFHASYQSSIDKPHPLIKSFLEYAKSYK